MERTEEVHTFKDNFLIIARDPDLASRCFSRAQRLLVAPGIAQELIPIDEQANRLTRRSRRGGFIDIAIVLVALHTAAAATKALEEGLGSHRETDRYERHLAMCTKLLNRFDNCRLVTSKVQVIEDSSVAVSRRCETLWHPR